MSTTIQFKRKDGTFDTIEKAKAAMLGLSGLKPAEPVVFYYGGENGNLQPLFGVAKNDGKVEIVGQYVSKLDESLATMNPVGGIGEGTTVSELNKKTITEILDSLLFPTIYPVSSDGSATLSSTNNGLVKVGTNLNVTLTATLIPGQWTLNGKKQCDYLGASGATTFIQSGGETGGVVLTPNGKTCTVAVTGIKYGQYKFNTTISYAQGPQAKDSTGANYGTPAPAGSKSASVSSFTGVYPYFASTSTAGVLTEQGLKSSATNTVLEMTLVPGEVGKPQQFELPETMKGGVVPTFKMKVFDPSTNTWKDIVISSYFNDGVETSHAEFSGVKYFKFIAKDEKIGERKFQVIL